MQKPEFHEIFIELCNAFPTIRIGDTVEGSWFRRLEKYKTHRVRAAFQLLASETKFPTLAAALQTVREITTNRVSYAAPPWGVCYKETLGDGHVQCGCGECHPEIYQQFSKRHLSTYGRYPWDNPQEPGKWEKRASELASNPGGRDGFIQLVKEIKQVGRDKWASGFTKASDCVTPL